MLTPSRWPRCNRLLIIGSGVDEMAASELALKIEEAAHVPCTPLGTEKVLHRHLPAADARTGAVLIRCDPSEARQRDARTANVGTGATVLAMPTITLARPAFATAHRSADRRRGCASAS